MTNLEAKRWTDVEEAVLRRKIETYSTNAEAFRATAEELGKTVGAVQQKWSKLNAPKKERKAIATTDTPKPSGTVGQRLMQLLLGADIQLSENSVITISSKELKIQF